MTCCMVDLQFMSFWLEGFEEESYSDWVTANVLAHVVSDVYGQRKVKLHILDIHPEDTPDELILDGRRQG